MNRLKHIFGTHHKLLTVPVLYTLWVFLFALLKKSLPRSCGSVPRFLTLLLAGVFFRVPLVTHAGLLEDIIFQITGYILYIAAWLFNLSIDYFVIKMGGLIIGSGGLGIGIGVSIDVIWKTVRDLVNLSFIFGLVYVGFKTILNAGTDTKALLSSIIIGALLVNFSLFISKAVIDVSNITANEIYKAMGIGTNATAGTPRAKMYVGDLFMEQFGLVELVTAKNSQKELTERFASAPAGQGTIMFAVGGGIFILVAAFVFAAGAILLLIRFGVLVILMMLSPIAFAATVFPAFKAYRDKWWNTLFSQAFFAPAYLFMLYITLHVAQSYAKETRAFDAMYTNGGILKNNFNTAIFFCLTIVLMVASLILAKQMGAYGASFATRTAGKVSAGAMGFMGRQTFGRLGQRFAQSQRLRDRASRGGFGGFMARRALSTSRFAAKSSYDARVIADKTGLAKASGLDIGKAQKGGFAQIQKDREKKELQYARDLGRNQPVIDAAEATRAAAIAVPTANIRREQRARDAELQPLREERALHMQRSVDRNLTDAQRADARTQAEAVLLQIQAVQARYQPVIENLEETLRTITAAQDTAVAAARVSREASYAQVVEGGLVRGPVSALARYLSGGRFGQAQGGFSLSPTTLLNSTDDNHEIAEAIRAYIRQSPAERQQNALLEAIRASGGTPPPAPPPPAP